MQEFNRSIFNAIEFCLSTSKECSSFEDIVTCLRSQNTLIHSKFRYALAKDIARFFSVHFGDCVKGMNLYGSTLEYTAGMYSDIDLILHVSFLDAEILRTIKELNRFLTDSYYRLLGQISDELSYFIDVHIINDDPSEQIPPSKSYLQYILQNDSVALC
ncbi:MAG: hypothetical protein N2484_00335 [Clostridia bacterium]|nr:hypothetical protein [Clostridia bacterium]